MDTPDGGDRPLVRETTLENIRKEPNFAQEEEPPQRAHALPAVSDYNKEHYAWGMTIDMNSCVGCNNCMWPARRRTTLRWSARSRSLSAATCTGCASTLTTKAIALNPKAYFQPVPCMQCENAPCEVVCPVGATVHSTEGLNDMVYNRCVGTRYCSNNCPYKVRRFNFLLFQDWETPQYKMMRNPDVSVRSRGVMEKCTYCVQRINEHRIDAERADQHDQRRRTPDGLPAVVSRQAPSFSATSTTRTAELRN